MKKRIITAVLSMVLCLGMSATVMAAPSPGNGAAATEDGTKVEYIAEPEAVVETANEEQKKVLNALKEQLGGFDLVTTGDAEADKEVVAKKAEVYKNLFTEVTGKKVASVDVKTTGLVDLKIEGNLTKPTKISFSAPGIKMGDSVIVLHMNADGTWESIEATATADGEITGVFASLSPVLWSRVALEEAPAADELPWSPEHYEEMKADYAAAQDAAAQDAAPAAVTSPKTADAAPVLPVLALVCLAGVVVCSRKVKFN